MASEVSTEGVMILRVGAVFINLSWQHWLVGERKEECMV